MLRKGSEQPCTMTARDLKLKKQLLIYKVILLRKLSFVLGFLPFLWNKSQYHALCYSLQHKWHFHLERNITL